MKSILLVKKFLGLVEMMSGLVNASFSFFCTLGITIICIRHYYEGCSVHGPGCISKIWSNLQITRYVESTPLFIALF